MASFKDYTLERLARVPKKPTYSSLNEPVLLFNRFRIYEVGTSLAAIVVFGVLKSNWFLSILIVASMLIGSPSLRKKLPPSFIYRKILGYFTKLPNGSFTWGRSHSSL